jgi:hypothetical protein
MPTAEEDVAQLTRALENAAKENHSLRDEIEAKAAEIEKLQKHQGLAGGISNAALCRGCYRWRLTFSVIVGAVLAAITTDTIEANKSALQRIAGTVEHAETLETIIFGATLAAPVVAAFIEWKWELYRAGYAGVFRALAELGAAFKKGLGRT